ncbi:MAG TPA: hypothetical protein VE971_00905, partial [Candidatus Eisenbacteria bacterium]|nr:hypothetical protein [Candidatus Eisenbacteria bacterium]
SVTVKIALPVAFVERFVPTVDLPDSSAIRVRSVPSDFCANIVDLIVFTTTEAMNNIAAIKMKGIIANFIFIKGL